MTRDKGRSGVDGWLFVFLVLVGVVTPLHHVFVIGDLYRWSGEAEASGALSPTAAMISFFTFAWIHVAAMLVAFWIVYRMWRVREWSTVRYAVIALWLLYPGPLVLEVGIGAAVMPVPVGETILNSASRLVWSCVFAMAGTVYLTSSVRVANTYRKPGSPGDADGTFG